jgi:hypothetical protein
MIMLFPAIIRLIVMASFGRCFQISSDLCPNYIPVNVQILSHENLIFKLLADSNLGEVAGNFELDGKLTECSIADEKYIGLSKRELWKYNHKHYPENANVTMFYDTVTEDCVTKDSVLSHTFYDRLAIRLLLPDIPIVLVCILLVSFESKLKRLALKSQLFRTIYCEFLDIIEIDFERDNKIEVFISSHTV